MCVQLQNISLTRNDTTLVQIHYFWTRLDVILWGGGIKFSSELKMTWRGKWNCFPISKSFDVWHRFCRSAFNGMKLDWMKKRKMPFFFRFFSARTIEKIFGKYFFLMFAGRRKGKRNYTIETTLFGNNW